jgi:hypothetical protein
MANHWQAGVTQEIPRRQIMVIIVAVVCIFLFGVTCLFCPQVVQKCLVDLFYGESEEKSVARDYLQSRSYLTRLRFVGSGMILLFVCIVLTMFGVSFRW